MIIDRIPLKPLWAPSRAFVEQSNLKKFQNWLFVKKGLYFRDYHDLWDWSVTDLEDFWESIWQFNYVKSHSMYWDVLVNSKKYFTDIQWFRGASISYAEHIFRHKNANRPALLYQSEREPLRELSWRELEKQVTAVVAYLRLSGVSAGDRVAAVLPNCPQAVVAFLATNAVGAVWSICSPEMNTSDILERFQQIEPKVLFVTDGYIQNGKSFDRSAAMKDLMMKLPTLKKTVLLPYLSPTAQITRTENWSEVVTTPAHALEFTPVPFEHPLWILFSSEANGKSKAITHSVGGCLLEHLKIFALHQNVKPGDRFFWPSATGTLTWNFSIAAMLSGATPLLYEGAVNYPNVNILWELAEKAKINHFGGNTAYFTACIKENVTLQGYRFNSLQSISSTDAALSSEDCEWIYQKIKKDVWLISLNSNSEIGSSFVGGCPTLPVYSGETQCRLLGCKLEGYDKKSGTIGKDSGEMILSQPMPSMPLSHFKS